MLADLAQSIQAVCPIDGVSSDGRIDFRPEATTEQRAAAQSIFDSWDWDNPHLSSVGAAKAWLANERWTREASGITVGNQFVSTNRDEMPVWQGMLLDTVFRPGVRTEFEYKPRGGQNTTLTPQQVGRCYECFAWYVAALFAVERQVALMLDATTTNAEREAVLSAIPWPQTAFTLEAPQ